MRLKLWKEEWVCSSQKQTTVKMSRILVSSWAGTKFITNCVSVPHFSYSENLLGIYTLNPCFVFCITFLSSTRIVCKTAYRRGGRTMLVWQLTQIKIYLEHVTGASGHMNYYIGVWKPSVVTWMRGMNTNSGCRWDLHFFPWYQISC